MEDLRIFFTSDIHGSNLVFRKALSAARRLHAHILIVAGDLLGKELQPIIREGERWYVRRGGKDVELPDSASVAAEKEQLGNRGVYYIECSRSYFQDLCANTAVGMERMKEEMIKRLDSWISVARAALSSANINLVLTPGNDDIEDIDIHMRETARGEIRYAVNEIVNLHGHDFIFYSDTNPSPWNTPREKTEKEIASELGALFKGASDPHSSVSCIHCPPYGTSLDLAPAVDRQLRPVLVPGVQESRHVGCKAVRNAIELNQPLLSLHGHVHESPGVEKVLGTMCFNPGTEYWTGTLCGYHILVTGDRRIEYRRLVG